METGPMIVSVMFFLFRVIAAAYCSSRADDLNRSAGGWAFFGLISPIIAMIIISCLKAKMVWHNDAS